ncbi:hypothetical protein BDV28DRAFT_130411 [Aspergillus coremiiformis]|uniref:Uncharacterized protein n=1 Tax=Aspergillus coremiiformis TaxID=138285 RepID=A0A5N6ZC56_9EURO|nr:hypothetical protein BDV28DRAFT_130411 [Aspergillus coremiiformis]
MTPQDELATICGLYIYFCSVLQCALDIGFADVPYHKPFLHSPRVPCACPCFLFQVFISGMHRPFVSPLQMRDGKIKALLRTRTEYTVDDNVCIVALYQVILGFDGAARYRPKYEGFLCS